MAQHINAMYYLAKGILGNVEIKRGIIELKIHGGSKPLAWQDERDNICVAVRQGETRVYNSPEHATQKKSWEVWFVQQIVNARTSIRCGQWLAQDIEPLDFMLLAAKYGVRYAMSSVNPDMAIVYNKDGEVVAGYFLDDYRVVETFGNQIHSLKELEHFFERITR